MYTKVLELDEPYPISEGHLKIHLVSLEKN